MKRTRARSTPRKGFSLIEVVVATGIFAFSIVAIIGLMSPMSKRTDDVLDGEVAARLSNLIGTELQRQGFAWSAANVPVAESDEPIILYASADGSRVRLAGIDADAALAGVAQPGISERDRYFLIEVRKHAAPLDFDPAVSSVVSVQSRVWWPYLVPAGPASDTSIAAGPGADPSAEVPENERRVVVFSFSIRP